MNKENRKIELVAYSPMWKKFYQREVSNLEKLLRKNLIETQHIGSTAIPAIKAKPILDILCVVHTLDGIELFKDEFEKMGLISKGDFGIPGRLYFQRLAPNGIDHLCHIHIYEKTNTMIYDHIDFRDYLNAEEEIAKEYESLKIGLMENHSGHPGLYQAGKQEFIEGVLSKLR